MVGLVSAPPRQLCAQEHCLGVREQHYTVVERPNRLFTAKVGVYSHHLSSRWIGRYYGTHLDLTIDPGGSGGPRGTTTHPLTRLGPQEARRRRPGHSGGGNFGPTGGRWLEGPVNEGCHRSGSKWVEVERAQRWVEVCHFGSTSGPLRAQPADTSDEVGRSELPASHVASLASLPRA